MNIEILISEIIEIYEHVYQDFELSYHVSIESKLLKINFRLCYFCGNTRRDTKSTKYLSLELPKIKSRLISLLDSAIFELFSHEIKDLMSHSKKLRDVDTQ